VWLNEIRLALDQEEEPVRFFFRDDDAGWANKQLVELLDCFCPVEIPIDLAVIPGAINIDNMRLFSRVVVKEGLIGVHQHGFRHSNHQYQGRKCEFGDDRTYSQQHADIKAGQDLLLDYFGDQVDPIFTPPWNRCNQDTVNALNDLGFTTLSRDNTGIPLDYQELRELPVNIDWFKKHHGMRLSNTELGLLIAQVIDSGETVGIMLHHEMMDHKERGMLKGLLELLNSHPMVKCERMKDTFGSSLQR
jgi:hypothetical protein